MIFDSKVIKYSDNVDTDVIIPARYLNTIDKKELAAHCMEDIDPDFGKKAAECHIVVAGYNFGCGSSREHAPIALKESGVTLVIAKSFARIFFRNAVNIGLAIFECPEACDLISNGDRIVADSDIGIITDVTTGMKFRTKPFPPFIAQIIADGGLVESVKRGNIK